MLRYVLKRLLQMIPVLIGVSLVVFFISSGNPDAVILQILGDGATDQQIAELVEELGYNKPVIVRYLDWLAGLLHGDLGKSHINNRDVWEAFMQTLPVTIRLSCLSVLVSIAISLPLGILSAMKNGTLIDNGSMVVALLGLATPNFWLGLMLIIFFSNQLGWFPSGGVRDGFMSYVLPAITVGTGMTANLTRQTRSSMLDVIRADYLRTARAKGVSERRVMVIVSSLGISTTNLIIALGVGNISAMTRTVRAAVLTVRNSEYVESARAIGMPEWKIIIKYIIPNCMSPIIVAVTLRVGSAIIGASSLSFLGLGVVPPAPEWGAMLSEGRNFVRGYPYITVFPGLAIIVSVLALNMFGDGLRDALDPKLRR